MKLSISLVCNITFLYLSNVSANDKLIIILEVGLIKRLIFKIECFS